MHFCRLLRPFVTYLRNVLGYRVLLYLDDFFIASKSGKAARKADCLQASPRLYHVLAGLGLMRHLTKSLWGKGTQDLDHLDFRLSTLTGLSTVTAKKQTRMRRMAGKMLRQVSKGCEIVSAVIFLVASRTQRREAGKLLLEESATGFQTPSAVASRLVTKMRCWFDNASVVLIVNFMVTAFDELMPDLRHLNEILQREGLVLDCVGYSRPRTASQTSCSERGIHRAAV